MDKFQSAIVAIAFASLAIYICLSIVNVEKSSKWIKWYWTKELLASRKRIKLYIKIPYYSK